MKNLTDVLIDELKDLSNAETQLREVLPQIVESTENEELKKTLEYYLEDTIIHVARLDKISDILNIKLDGHICHAMKGLVKECIKSHKESYKTNVLKDLMIIAAIKKVVQYKITSYGSSVSLSNFLGMNNISVLLSENIHEGGETNKKLDEIWEESLFHTYNYKGIIIEKNLFL